MQSSMVYGVQMQNKHSRTHAASIRYNLIGAFSADCAHSLHEDGKTEAQKRQTNKYNES